MTFNVNSFTYNGNNRTGSETSTDQFVTVALQNIGNDDEDWWAYGYGPTNDGYIQMGRRGWQTTYRGDITVTPAENIRITGNYLHQWLPDQRR